MKLGESLMGFALRNTLRGLLRPVLSPGWPVTMQRRWLETMSRISRLPRGVEPHNVTVGGVPAVRWQADRAPSGNAGTILFLHGGGYCVGSPFTHRALAAWLAYESDIPVVVPDYRLAPEHPFPAAMEDALAVYDVLCEDGSVAISGDSAGGGLALSLALEARDSDRPMPAGLALISPWVDLREEHQPALVRGEAMLSVVWMRTCAKSYADGIASDARVSPILADLRGLPPVLIQCGTDEMLYDQAHILNMELLGAGVESALEVEPKRWHVYQIHAGQLPSASAAAERLAHFLMRKVVSDRDRDRKGISSGVGTRPPVIDDRQLATSD